MSGKLCPVCQKDVGIWSIIKAPLPSQIHCPHCASRLKYRGNHLPMIALSIVAFLAILFVVVSATNIIHTMASWLAAILISLLCGMLWLPFELFFALYLRSKFKLKVCERHHKDRDNPHKRNSNSHTKTI